MNKKKRKKIKLERERKLGEKGKTYLRDGQWFSDKY